MRSGFLQLTRLQVILAGLWLCGILHGAPPPADGVLDETRALTEETHRQLARELALFHKDLKCDAWIMATSFTSPGLTLRRQAQETRSQWSGERSAVLMAYDRASNSTSISFSPDFWQRYPSAELVEIMQDTRRTLLDTKLTLDERLAVATRYWIDRLRVMESVRLKQSLLFQRNEKRFLLGMVITLACGSLLAAVLGFLSRALGARADRRFQFPEIHVGMRFGAPYGGGVTAEIKAHASPQ